MQVEGKYGHDMSLRRLINEFVLSRRGNVAMMTCLLAVPMIALLGGAVDIMYTNQVKKELQSALDAGVLALSEIGNNSDPKKTMEEFLKVNLADSAIDPAKVGLAVTATSNLNSKTVDVSASYTHFTKFLGIIGIDSIDLGLDASGRQEYQEVEVAMVLDVSSSMNGKKLTNLKTSGAEFIDAVLTDAVKDMTTISIVPFGGTVNLGDIAVHLADGATIDNNDDDNHSDGHLWRGCIELDANDYDDGWFESMNNAVVPNFYVWHYGNPWCPPAADSILTFSNDASALKSKIDGFVLSDGTGMDIGAAIGAKVLSPQTRVAMNTLTGSSLKVPADYDTEVLKVMIIMTDGEITAQLRPKDTCFHAVGGGCQKTLYKENKAETNFKDICQEAKDNGIIVYTIGFQIKKGKQSDKLLKACASSPSQYHFVETVDVGVAFKSIAASINSVRLTD